MNNEDEEARRASSAVGELVLIASALDHQLNRICISVLNLGSSPMIESVVAAVDGARKIEILKAYAEKITASDWRKGIRTHVEAVESVNRLRNIAAHSILTFSNGKAVLSSPSAAKLLKAIDMTTKTARKTSLGDIQEAIKRGEAVLGSGQNLLKSFERVAVELSRKKRSKS